MTKRICGKCGNAYNTRQKTGRAICKACKRLLGFKSIHHFDSSRLITECLFCGKSFKAKERGKQTMKYCSSECRTHFNVGQTIYRRKTDNEFRKRYNQQSIDCHRRHFHNSFYHGIYACIYDDLRLAIKASLGRPFFKNIFDTLRSDFFNRIRKM